MGANDVVELDVGVRRRFEDVGYINFLGAVELGVDLEALFRGQMVCRGFE